MVSIRSIVQLIYFNKETSNVAVTVLVTPILKENIGVFEVNDSTN